jgi:hypothetical protein
LRLRSFDTATLNRTSGSPGEIFYDNTLKTLRISNGAGREPSIVSLGTREITVIVDVLAPLSNVGEGTPISIVNNHQTERVLVSNTLQGEGRVLLPNVSVYGKIVILVTTSPDETFIDRNIWNGSMDTGTITDDPGDVVILMSLAAGGWKTIT